MNKLNTIGTALVVALSVACSSGEGFSTTTPQQPGVVAGNETVAGNSGIAGNSSAVAGNAGSKTAGIAGVASSAGVCSPGATQACLCVGNLQGVQTCSNNGTIWNACDCSSVAVGGSAGNPTMVAGNAGQTVVAGSGSVGGSVTNPAGSGGGAFPSGAAGQLVAGGFAGSANFAGTAGSSGSSAGAATAGVAGGAAGQPVSYGGNGQKCWTCDDVVAVLPTLYPSNPRIACSTYKIDQANPTMPSLIAYDVWDNHCGHYVTGCLALMPQIARAPWTYCYPVVTVNGPYCKWNASLNMGLCSGN
jgi:hypothetical protein